MSLYVPLEAVVDTIDRRMCPLYSVDNRGRVQTLGSSVPFKSGRFPFLITAAHVCQELAQSRAPVFTIGSNGPRALTGIQLFWEHKPGWPGYDLALIALSEEDAADLSGYFQFSVPETTTSIKPRTRGTYYLIAGFPSTRNRVDPSRPSLPALATSLPAVATWLISGNVMSVSGLRLAGKTDKHHFALGVKGEKIRMRSGEPYHMPKPQGMSGGGVWLFDIDPETKLVTTRRLVGIGIEYHKSKEVFVASRIQMAIPLAHDLLSLLSGIQPADVVQIEGSVKKPETATQTISEPEPTNHVEPVMVDYDVGKVPSDD